MYRNKDRRGRKPTKTPDNAIMYLIRSHHETTYTLKQRVGLNPGRVSKSSHKDVKRLSLNFFLQLAAGLHMDLEDMIHQLLQLQKQFPPKTKYEKRELFIKHHQGPHHGFRKSN